MFSIQFGRIIEVMIQDHTFKINRLRKEIFVFLCFHSIIVSRCTHSSLCVNSILSTYISVDNHGHNDF